MLRLTLRPTLVTRILSSQVAQARSPLQRHLVTTITRPRIVAVEPAQVIVTATVQSQVLHQRTRQSGNLYVRCHSPLALNLRRTRPVTLQPWTLLTRRTYLIHWMVHILQVSSMTLRLLEVVTCALCRCHQKLRTMVIIPRP